MNTLPLFYHAGDLPEGQPVELEEDTTRHVVQVLRKKEGDLLLLTDGRGTAARAVIIQAIKKKCRVVVREAVHHAPPGPALHLAIAFTKNPGRNEWLLEKATELGVRRITPLQAARSERERFRPDRWQHILVSAMLQSQQYYLPVLAPPATVQELLAADTSAQRLIAHCIPELSREPLQRALLPGEDTLLCIGPEGDFTPEEVTLAIGQGCRSISLGGTRLRTETAAMTACAFFQLINDGTR